MNARTRFDKERPFAARVVKSAEHLGRTPMLPDQAHTAGLFAIAHAILDLSEAIRQTAKEETR